MGAGPAGQGRGELQAVPRGSKAWIHSRAACCSARPGACDSAAHGTAQRHSTAQHGTAQHSAAQHTLVLADRSSWLGCSAAAAGLAAASASFGAPSLLAGAAAGAAAAAVVAVDAAAAASAAAGAAAGAAASCSCTSAACRRSTSPSLPPSALSPRCDRAASSWACTAKVQQRQLSACQTRGAWSMAGSSSLCARAASTGEW